MRVEFRGRSETALPPDGGRRMLTADEASYCEVRLGPAAGLAPDGISPYRGLAPGRRPGPDHTGKAVARLGPDIPPGGCRRVRPQDPRQRLPGRAPAQHRASLAGIDLRARAACRPGDLGRLARPLGGPGPGRRPMATRTTGAVTPGPRAVSRGGHQAGKGGPADTEPVGDRLQATIRARSTA